MEIISPISQAFSSVTPQTPINPEHQAASSEPQKEAFLYSPLTINT